jgi:subtilisin family serine protease
MSWGYNGAYSYIAGGNYRGTTWVGSSTKPQYGMIGYYFNATYSPVDVVAQDCLNAGVILVGAAGNAYGTMDVPGGLDYNNYYNNAGSGRQYYYMRGGTPTGVPNVVCVGSVDIGYSGGLERKAGYSNSGPRVDVYSPGTQVVSTLSTVYDPEFAQYPYGVNSYPYNSSFKIANVSGTSMASPNVAGIAAQLLQIHPGESPAQIRQRIIDLSTPNMLYSTGLTTDYSDQYSLHGSVNRYAYFPLSNTPVPPTPNNNFIATGAIEMNNPKITT